MVSSFLGPSGSPSWICRESESPRVPGLASRILTAASFRASPGFREAVRVAHIGSSLRLVGTYSRQPRLRPRAQTRIGDLVAQ